MENTRSACALPTNSSTIAATKALLAEQPALLNATSDWGGFETGLGGAGHIGNRKAWLATWPNLLHSKGPHGISLSRHARAGKDAAKPVEKYLRSWGAE